MKNTRTRANGLATTTSAHPNKKRGLLRYARPVLSSLIATTMVFTTAASASADTFFFRYKTEIAGNNVVIPPIGDPTLEAGNDITIFFAGVIGRSFSKSIPVKTKAVAEWRIVSGSLQPGLQLDAAKGVISGVAEGPEAPRSALLKGYDVSGNLVARADISFRFHAVFGDEQQFSFYGHTGKYMYRQIPSSVPVDHWVATTDLPKGFHTEGSYLAGTPAQPLQTDVAFIGYDYMGEEISYAYGDILVEDASQILTVADQTRRPDESFNVQPAVAQSLGAIDWRLVALDTKPSTLKINPVTGMVYGYIKTFDTSLRFQVQAMDIDGTIGTSNVFTLSTTSPDLELASVKDLHATVGTPYSVKFKASDLVGAQSWKLNAGKLPDGLSFDVNTGTISGTPTKIGVEDGLVVSVTTSEAGYSESNPFKFTVDAVPLSVSFAEADVRTNESFTTTGPTFGTGVVAPYSFSLIDPASVDPSLMVDASTAVISGTLSAAGDYSVPFTFHNGDGREKTPVQLINAYDPLTLAYNDLTVYRRLPATAQPTTDWNSVIGAASFSLSGDALPEGMALSSTTGDINGTVQTFDGATGVSVTLADESGDSVASNLFDITVEDRPNVEVSAANVDVERLVGNNVQAATAQNTFDGVSFTLTEGALPNGLTLDADGVIRGVTDAVPGVVSGLKVMAVDGEGYSAESDYFSINIVQPKDLAPLSQTAAEATWTQGSPFTLQLPAPSNAWGSVTYGFLGLPDGVSVVDGKLVGQIDQLGDYVWPMVMTDQAGRTLSANYTLHIIEAMTAELDGPGLTRGEEDPDEITFGLPRGSAATISASVSNAIEPITYKLEGSVPAGLTFANGAISGKPLVEGDTGQFKLTVTDAAGTSIPLPASINVLERLPISLSYDIVSPSGYVGTQIAPLKPTITNSIGTVAFTVDGVLPPGLSLDPKTGYIYGTPTADGRFKDIIVSAADSDGGADYAGTYGPFEIGIALNGLAVLPINTFLTVRAGQAFETTITATNVTAPVIYATASGNDLPHGVGLDSFTGKISGMLPDAGQYPMGSIVAIDTFDRQAATSLIITAVGPLAIAAPTATEFHQYSSAYAKPQTTNAIGSTTYKLVSGTLPKGLAINTKTGAISGTPTVMGTSSGLVIKVTDSTGSSVQTLPFALTITDRLPLEMNTADSYTVNANGGYSLVMPVVNAVGATTFVQSGTLPPGISFDAVTGTFSGSTNVLGSYPGITVKVTDSVGASVTKTFTMVSQVSGPIRLFFRDYATRLGESINTGATLWLNTIGEVTFSDDDGQLAAHGLTLDPKTGRITGSATELMDFNPNISITDETNRITSGTFNIKVVPALGINAPERIELAVNTAINPQIYVTAANSTSAKVEWEINGTLPSGMVFSKTYARFSGTPKEFGTFPVELWVHEVDGFQDWASKKVTIAIVTDGKAPTVSVTPSSVGYDVTTAATITPKYGNAKVGDVLSLAPDSAPLPPGMTIDKNAAGVNVLKKAIGSVSDVGIYRGIKLRVTDGSGAYGESAAFTIAYRANLAYPAVKVNAQAYVPVTVATPTPSAGVPTGDVTYSFAKDFSAGTLKIDPATGAISGYVLGSGANTVQVTESYDGIILRKTAYTVTFTTVQVSLSISSDLVTYTDMPFPATVAGYVPTIKNPVSGSVLSLVGSLPSGLSFNPSTGALVGTPTASGAFPLQLVYTDQYQTLSQKFTLRVEQADSTGYKFARITVTSSVGYTHIWNAIIRSASGYDLMHLVTVGAGNTTTALKEALKSKTHVPEQFGKNVYQVWNFPVGIPKGSLSAGAHGGVGSTYVTAVSKDGITWTDVATASLNDDQNIYTAQFQNTFGFNTNTITSGFKRKAYSFDVSTLLDQNSMKDIPVSSVSWSWAVDPGRDTKTTMSTLPAGLTLANGIISGTPTNSGTYAILLTAQASGQKASKAYTLQIDLQTTSIVLAGGALPDGTYSLAYSRDIASTLTATNLPASEIKWSASTTGVVLQADEIGGLPGGLTMTQTGVISGTATAKGKFRFMTKATWDNTAATAEHAEASKEYTITIAGRIYKFKKLSQSWIHSCGITMDDTLQCWGNNGYGQLGDGSTTNANGPTDVPGLTGVTDVVTGYYFSCALSNGGVKCWGRNDVGQLGNGAVLDAANTAPVDVVGLTSGVKAIGASSGNVCAILSADSTVKCWGEGANGSLGNGSTTSKQSTPVVATGLQATQISGGNSFLCAITTAGAVKCWGKNDLGQIGNNSGTNSNALVPTQVSGLTSGYKKVSGGADQACAVSTSGAARCWGGNGGYQLGDGTVTTRKIPVTPTGLTAGVTDISAGYMYSCAVVNGGVQCWGTNPGGNLGTGNTTQVTKPAAATVFPTTGVTQVYAAPFADWFSGTYQEHTCIVTSSNQAMCIGRNMNGQLGNFTNTNALTAPVYVGG